MGAVIPDDIETSWLHTSALVPPATTVAAWAGDIEFDEINEAIKLIMTISLLNIDAF